MKIAEIAIGIAVIFATVAALLYFWGGVCFLILRQVWPETEPAMKRFLNYHAPFFLGRSRSQLRPEEQITPQIMKKQGLNGWRMTSVSGILLLFHFSWWTLLVASLPLIFGGLSLAYSWYGIRCLRLLNLESYPAAGFGEENAPAVDRVSERTSERERNRKVFVFGLSIIAVGLFGGDFYLFVASDFFSWWMPVFSILVFGFVTYRFYERLIKER